MSKAETETVKKLAIALPAIALDIQLLDRFYLPTRYPDAFFMRSSVINNTFVVKFFSKINSNHHSYSISTNHY